MWLDQLVSRSDYAALEPAVRDRLFEAIGAAINDQGGSFVMNFETVLITATRLGSPRDRRSAAPWHRPGGRGHLQSQSPLHTLGQFSAIPEPSIGSAGTPPPAVFCVGVLE
jgi:hypothetical protein